MKPEQIEELRSLLADERVLGMSVLLDGAPYVGLLPFVVTPDYGAALVHASKLARHTRGLEPGAPFSVLVHRPDRPDADPLQIQRVTLQGTVQVPERQSEQYHQWQQLYVHRFPTSERTFALGDFSLYALRFEKGRYVGGFAQAVTIRSDDLKQLAPGQA